MGVISAAHPGQEQAETGISVQDKAKAQNEKYTVTQKVVQQTRNALNNFFAHLTAPGLRAPSSAFPIAARSMHTGTNVGIQNIRSNLSFPVRHALSRGPHLPRAHMVPRTTMQVGLGSARNFSSARPIFQNLAQNVPVAGRAFWEADWDVIKMRDERRVKMGKENGSKAQAKSKEMIKPTIKSDISTSDSEAAAELEHYFPTANPTTADLTTYLLIPIAPTPTSRLPLASDSERFLPLPALAMRVSSLFARLDTANVWHKEVSCDAYSTGRHSNEQGDGVCTILRVTFTGWTAAEVRSVIGESGTGWCELYEARSPTVAAMSDVDSEDGASETDAFSDADSQWASHDGGAHENDIDPSQSFVLPTLDFSSSFLAAPSAGPSPALSRAPSEIDMLSYASLSPDATEAWETGTSSDGGSGESWAQPSVHSSSRFGFGFSSDFAGRVGAENMGLREPQPRL
ncbi:hypothetical protein FIBSPDRAFT_921034 [Athelia psychrophila]|uniref:Uncharacterized protein n=1 Tax=Athelia psychrophila TaxID=1759441 RepID=A0A166EUY6_9AGAM|nr:hypothetical protein FIBSPDRAFT_921034 [Fibularhizoctonia sp. CBS 109695]